MKDGRIVQTATPEELVLNPATEYVAEFTKHIPRGKVLSVGAVMAPRGRGPFAGASGCTRPRVGCGRPGGGRRSARFA